MRTLPVYILTVRCATAGRLEARAELANYFTEREQPVIFQYGPDIQALGELWQHACPDFVDLEAWKSETRGPGSICCMQGHLDIWRKFYASGLDCCLVFEDDAIIDTDFDLMTPIAQLPRNADWALLHHTHSGVAEEDRLKTWLPVNADTHGMGSIAYVLTRKGAFHLIQHNQPLCATPDHTMRLLADTCECYVSGQELVKHDANVMSHIGLTHLENVTEPYPPSS